MTAAESIFATCVVLLGGYVNVHCGKKIAYIMSRAEWWMMLWRQERLKMIEQVSLSALWKN
jgi:hypothetical protein